MDLKSTGSVDVDDIIYRFDPTGHPEVLNNKKSKN